MIESLHTGETILPKNFFNAKLLKEPVGPRYETLILVSSDSEKTLFGDFHDVKCVVFGNR